MKKEIIKDSMGNKLQWLHSIVTGEKQYINTDFAGKDKQA